MDDFERYMNDRESRDPEFKRLREDTEPLFEISSAVIGIRIKKNLTQKQFAVLVGLKLSTITKIEDMEEEITMDILLKLSKVLKIEFAKDGEIKIIAA